MASDGGMPRFWPPVASFCAGGGDIIQRDHFVFPAPAKLWTQPGVPTTFADVTKGEAIGAAVCGLNGILTAAVLNKGITVELERVYSDALPPWEESNPGCVPQDEHFLGYYFHFFGALPDMVAFTGELQRLVENSAVARTNISPREPPPSPVSLVRITKSKVFQSILFCQEGAPIGADRDLEAEYDDLSFDEWASLNDRNRNNVLSRLHHKTQRACQDHIRHPFHRAVAWQKIGPITDDARKRGFVYRLTEGLVREFSPFDMTKKKQELVIGFDYLFCRKRFLRPEYRPPSAVISNNKQRMYVGDAEYERDRRPLHIQAPQYHIAQYHGDEVSAAGDERIGRDFPVLQFPSVDVPQAQFPSDMFAVIARQYKTQSDLGCKIRAELDALPEERRRSSDIECILRKFLPVIRTMLRMSEDDIPQPPEGVVPALAEVVDFNARQDPEVMPLPIEYGEGCVVNNIISDLLGILLLEYRQYTPRQTILGYFAIVNQLTVLMSTRHGARIIVQGPPESGKSDVCDFVGRLLGPMAKRSDLQTEAASKHPGKGGENTDCRTTINDEGNKEQTTNQRLLEQTGVETGFTEVTMMIPRDDGRWEKKLVQCMKRGGAILTANEHKLSPAQLSRTMAVTMPKVQTHQNQARRANIPEEQLRRAIDNVRAVLVGAAAVGAPADHLFIRNCPPSRLPTQILGLLLERARITLTPRQFKRIEDFAIGIQTLVLHHLLYRLPTFSGLPEERKWIIHQCNMYPNPQGLLVGMDLYRSLTGDTEYFSNFMASVKMLIKTKDGITEQDGLLQLEEVKTNKYQNSIDGLLTQVEKVAVSCGFNPGRKFLQQALDNANSNPDGLVIVEREDRWYLSKAISDKYLSFAEEVFVDAIREHLGPFDKPSKNTVFPQSSGTYMASAEFMVVPLPEIRASHSDAPAIKAFQKLSPTHLEHAIATLAKRMTDGRQVFSKLAGQVYTAGSFITEAQYAALPDTGGTNSKAKAKKHPLFDGVWMFKSRTPIDEPCVIHISLLKEHGAEADAVGEVAEAYLAAFGDYSGTHRMYGIDSATTEAKGVDIDPTNDYRVEVKNPNYRRQDAKKSKFKKRPQLTDNPLSTAGAVLMDQSSPKLVISKESNFGERVFVEQALCMGLSLDAATKMSKTYSLTAMLKRVAAEARLAVGDVAEAAPVDAVPMVAGPVMLPFQQQHHAEAVPSDEESEVASPKRSISSLFEDTGGAAVDDDVVVRDPSSKKKKKKRRLLRSFVDDEAGASGGSSDEDVRSETSYDRGFLDDEVGSGDDMAGPAPLLDSD